MNLIYAYHSYGLWDHTHTNIAVLLSMHGWVTTVTNLGEQNLELPWCWCMYLLRQCAHRDIHLKAHRISNNMVLKFPAQSWGWEVMGSRYFVTLFMFGFRVPPSTWKQLPLKTGSAPHKEWGQQAVLSAAMIRVLKGIPALFTLFNVFNMLSIISTALL